jgi:hypothetical protein
MACRFASCAERKDMPGKRTILQWLARYEDFAHQYARAREEQADLLFEQCLAIAVERGRNPAMVWLAGM